MRILCAAIKAVTYAILLILAIHPTRAFAYVGGFDPGSEFSSSVRIVMNSGGNCTAVKVAERFLLTAAHCNRWGDLDRGKTVCFANFTGTCAPGVSTTTRVKGISFHSSWTSLYKDGVFQGYEVDDFLDLAVVELENDLSFAPSSKISLRPIRSGDQIVVGGFGRKGGAFTNMNLTMAHKAVVEVGSIHFYTGLEDYDGSSLSFAVNGDSGGPVYRMNASKTGFEVVGINHGVTRDDQYLYVEYQTGKIFRFQGRLASFAMLMTLLENSESPNAPDIASWLKANLPPNAFASD